jgi:SAM-dependent methyltransferase
MEDVYNKGYGNLFPDSNIVSVLVNYLRDSNNFIESPKECLKLLDIGCGIASNLFFPLEFENLHYQGIDISEIAVAKAEARIKKYGLEKRARVKSVSSEIFLQSCVEKFDLILDCASLQHHDFIQDKDQTLRFFRLIAEKLSLHGTLISVWAGKEILGSNKRFYNFRPYEEVEAELDSIFKIIEVKKISKFNLTKRGETKLSEEFLILAKKKELFND